VWSPLPEIICEPSGVVQIAGVRFDVGQVRFYGLDQLLKYVVKVIIGTEENPVDVAELVPVVAGDKQRVFTAESFGHGLIGFEIGNGGEAIAALDVLVDQWDNALVQGVGVIVVPCCRPRTPLTPD